jgi:predicted metal-dependent peptidase
MNLQANDRVARARTQLLLDAPFFGALALRLHVEEKSESECPTMQTDGTRLEYSVPFVNGLNDTELKGVVAHEVLHCALRHMYRTNGRDMDEWNIACDYVVNAELIGQGFTLPEGALHDTQYAGLSAEQVYSTRGRNKSKQPQPNGQGQGQQTGQGQTGQQTGQQTPSNQSGSGQAVNGQQTPAQSPTGTFTAPQPQTGSGQGQPEAMTEQDWEIATEQAIAVASKAGVMGAGVARAVKVSRTPAEDWRAILREFIEHTCPSDYSWTNPNRRHLGAGVYLPGTVKENMPRLAVAVDTSGSITPALLELFATELTGVLHDARPESIEVIYCDARVNGTDSFNPDDTEVKLRVIGGGGTAFNPVFDHVAEWDTAPAALIYFTDMQSSDVPVAPDYPVLWITPEGALQSRYAINPGFGRNVELSEWA